MNIYLAARYSRREELCGYRKQLEEVGHVVTSRWLNGDHPISDDGLNADDESERVRYAEEDWSDLLAADWVINFTEQPRGTSSRGGRHVEFGAALALQKYCFVIGPRENVFHHMPCVMVHGSFDAFLKATGIGERAYANYYTTSKL
jgi:hypothetical protein